MKGLTFFLFSYIRQVLNRFWPFFSLLLWCVYIHIRPRGFVCWPVRREPETSAESHHSGQSALKWPMQEQATGQGERRGSNMYLNTHWPLSKCNNKICFPTWLCLSNLYTLQDFDPGFKSLENKGRLALALVNNDYQVWTVQRCNPSDHPRVAHACWIF